MPRMFLASYLLPRQDNDKVAKMPHGITSTEKLPRDSAVYFKSSDNDTVVKGQKKEHKNAFT